MKGLKLKVDYKKQPYAEPKFMLPPDSQKLPIPFENLRKKTATSSNFSGNTTKSGNSNSN